MSLLLRVEFASTACSWILTSKLYPVTLTDLRELGTIYLEMGYSRDYFNKSWHLAVNHSNSSCLQQIIQCVILPILKTLAEPELAHCFYWSHPKVGHQQRKAYFGYLTAINLPSLFSHCLHKSIPSTVFRRQHWTTCWLYITSPVYWARPSHLPEKWELSVISIHELPNSPIQGVITHMLPIEVFATEIKNLDRQKSSLIAWSSPSAALDCLIVLTGRLDRLIYSQIQRSLL